MRPLGVEEGLDYVEFEIKQFHRRFNTDDFHLLSCGPDPQHIGRSGGAIGVVMWACEEEKFQDCKKQIQPLLEAIEGLDLVLDVEVELALVNDGEIWYIEFVPECDLVDLNSLRDSWPWKRCPWK